MGDDSRMCNGPRYGVILYHYLRLLMVLIVPDVLLVGAKESLEGGAHGGVRDLRVGHARLVINVVARDFALVFALVAQAANVPRCVIYRVSSVSDVIACLWRCGCSRRCPAGCKFGRNLQEW